MITVYKYPVQATDEFRLSLPLSAEVLHVGVQRGEPYLWVKLDTEEEGAERSFFVVGTGHSMDARASRVGRYVGTFMLDGGALVFHVFEQSS